MMGLDGEQKEDNLMVEGFNTPDSRNIKPCITKISMVLSHMALVFLVKMKLSTSVHTMSGSTWEQGRILSSLKNISNRHCSKW